jgi:hypothetical protein
MRISKVLLSALFVLIVLVNESCKKDEADDYLVCGNCSNTEICGDYTGNGQYFTDYKPDITEGTDVKLNLRNLENNLFEAKVEVLDKFSKTYFVARLEGSAALTISGTNESINLTVYKKDNEYKINGTAKVYHTQGDTLFLDHSVSFTVFK